MEQSVEVIVKETITEHVNIDQALQQRLRTLVERALDYAEDALDFGTASEKQQVMRTLLAASTRNLGKDFTTAENEARIALERLFEGQREPIEQHAVELVAPTPRIDYSDEGPDN